MAPSVRLPRPLPTSVGMADLDATADWLWLEPSTEIVWLKVVSVVNASFVLVTIMVLLIPYPPVAFEAVVIVFCSLVATSFASETFSADDVTTELFMFSLTGEVVVVDMLMTSLLGSGDIEGDGSESIDCIDTLLSDVLALTTGDAVPPESMFGLPMLSELFSPERLLDD